MKQPKLYTATEAADLIGVNPETVKRWHRTGKIEAVKVGERWLRFPESEIKRILGD
jgi:excisionase family DNA binding protein